MDRAAGIPGDFADVRPLLKKRPASSAGENRRPAWCGPVGMPFLPVTVLFRAPSYVLRRFPATPSGPTPAERGRRNPLFTRFDRYIFPERRSPTNKDTRLFVPSIRKNIAYMKILRDAQLESWSTRRYAGTVPGLDLSRNLADLFGGRTFAGGEYGRESTLTSAFGEH